MAQLFELIISWGVGLRFGKTWFLERLKSGIGWNASEGTVSPCRAGTVATCLCGSKRRWPAAWYLVEESELNGAANSLHSHSDDSFVHRIHQSSRLF
jgi:hypothetical protein